MKSSFLVTLGLCVALLSGMSAGVPVNKRQTSLPPLIPSRLKLPPPGTVFGGNAEAKAVEVNGELPSDVEQVGGMAVEVEAPPGLGNDTLTRRDENSVYIAGPEEIAELTFATILSANAYCRSVVPGGNWNCKNCKGVVGNLVLVQTFTTLLLDTNAAILRDDANSLIYVVFRGPSSVRSFATNLGFIAKNYPPVNQAKVHSGFYDGYSEVQGSLVPAVLNLLTAYPNYKIVVTGHSLGGAYAVLHALDLFQRDLRITPNNIQIITQGQPRVGDLTFAGYTAYTSIRYRRVVNNRDVVPHLPPQLFGYRHAGVEYWIRNDKSVKVCDYVFETDNCGNSIVPFTTISDDLTYFGYNTGLCL